MSSVAGSQLTVSSEGEATENRALGPLDQVGGLVSCSSGPYWRARKNSDLLVGVMVARLSTWPDWEWPEKEGCQFTRLLLVWMTKTPLVLLSNSRRMGGGTLGGPGATGAGAMMSRGCSAWARTALGKAMMATRKPMMVCRSRLAGRNVLIELKGIADSGTSGRSGHSSPPRPGRSYCLVAHISK